MDVKLTLKNVKKKPEQGQKQNALNESLLGAT